MGAKRGIWVQRVLVFLLSVAGFFIVCSLPLPFLLKAFVVLIGVMVGGYIAFLRIPAFDPFFRVRWRLPKNSQGKKWCAITFDDGPSPSTTKILDILKEEGVRATFFMVGNNALRYPDIARRVQKEGHVVGLHGLEHKKLHNADAGEVERQITGCIEALRSIGIEPCKIYRSPHGFKSRALFRVAKKHGLKVWAWSRGIWDTDRPPPDVLVRRATRLARSGMVLLVHDGHRENRDPDISSLVVALPAIIKELKSRGFLFVTLDAFS